VRGQHVAQADARRRFVIHDQNVYHANIPRRAA
jgi:hypothetical protein